MTLRMKKPGEFAHPLARQLYLLMKAEEMTVQELSMKAVVSDNAISRFLEGSGNTTLKNLIRIFDVFGMDLKATAKLEAQPRKDAVNGQDAKSERR